MLNSNESLKNKEWLRRRRLRLEQVRKQSNNVAKQLRDRMAWKDRQKAEEQSKSREKEFMKLKVKALSDLERKYRSCISEIGAGHQLATAEPDVEHILSEKNEMNLNKAEKRGKNAALQEMREKKESNKKKLSHVRRKKLTREIEDIRSNLVCSLPKNQAPLIREELKSVSAEKIDTQNDCLPESSCSTPRKMFLPIKGQNFNEGHVKKISKEKAAKKKKKIADQAPFVKNLPDSSRTKSSSLSKTVRMKSVLSSSQNEQEKIWINLNDINLPMSQDSEIKSKSRSSKINDAAVEEPRENLVEFYNFPSWYCKSYRECDSLVERIDDPPELDAVELARFDEEEKIIEEDRKKENADVITERGNKALAKEKLKREYSDLMSQLETLSKKERKAKSNRRIPPAFVHMTDERLAEITNRKQKNMDSKFEAMYYSLTKAPRPAEQVLESDLTSDNISEESIPQLNVAWSSNLKSTSLAENGIEINEDGKKLLKHEEKGISNLDSSKETIKYVRKKISRQKEKRDLIKNVERTLQKSRKIRKEATRIVEKSSTSISDLSSVNNNALEISDKDENLQSSSCSDSPEVVDSVKISIKIPEVVTRRNTETFSIPRENVVQKISSEKESPSKLQSDLSVNKKQFLEYSLPLSASTCYKSPPSELYSGRIGHLINFLKNLNISQKSDKIDDVFQDGMDNLLDQMSKENKEKDSKIFSNPELTYYISKLLGMSREVVANLNVSSVSEISTPYMTDLENSYNVSIFSKTGDESSGGSSQAIIGSDFSDFPSVTEKEKFRAYRLKQAEEVEAKHKEWKSILDDKARISERNFKKPAREPSLLKNNEHVHWTKTEDDIIFKLSDSSQRNKLKNDYVMNSQNPKKENKYDKITMKCSQRISELSEKLEQVRKEKEKLLNSSSGNSSFSFKLEKSPSKDQKNRSENYPKQFSSECDRNSEKTKDNDLLFCSKKKASPALEDFTNRYKLSPTKAHYLSTIIEADSPLLICKSKSSASVTSDSIPNVMDELFQRNIMTSPFHWSGEDTLSYMDSSPVKDASFSSQHLSKIRNGNEFRPLYSEVEEVKFQTFWSVDSNSLDKSEKLQGINLQDETTDSILLSALDDSSLDNMNHILSTLGLKWAKPLFKKNEALKTMSTSSNSDQKVSPSSCKKLNFETESSLVKKNYKKN